MAVGTGQANAMMVAAKQATVRDAFCPANFGQRQIVGDILKFKKVLDSEVAGIWQSTLLFNTVTWLLMPPVLAAGGSPLAAAVCAMWFDYYGWSVMKIAVEARQHAVHPQVAELT